MELSGFSWRGILALLSNKPGARFLVTIFGFPVFPKKNFLFFSPVFLVQESPGDLGEPRGIKKCKQKKKMQFFVDVYVGNKSALFDH